MTQGLLVYVGPLLPIKKNKTNKKQQQKQKPNIYIYIYIKNKKRKIEIMKKILFRKKTPQNYHGL